MINSEADATPYNPRLHKKEKKWWHTILVSFKFLFLLYVFFLSISLISSAFKFFGEGLATQLIQTTSDPVLGLFIGLLVTSIIQSSSSTTSLVVGLVGAGALSISNAIPIIMGANVGTSVTNALVSIAHITRSGEFRRAFAAATVHDFFNIITITILFPLQYFTNFLTIECTFLAKVFQHLGGLKFASPLIKLTAPAQRVIEHLFHESGTMILIIAIAMLFAALKYIVSTLKSIFAGKLEIFFDKYIFKSPLRGLLFGLVITALVQSSSITTSMVVPLAAAGMLTIEQIFPYTLGANIGTTVTAMLASLATNNLAAVIVAFAHLSFNVIGVMILYPLRVVPITLANTLAEYSLKSKLIPLLFILLVFFLIPLSLIYLLR